MVGRLGRNLRRGHQAQHEGINLLRQLCAVAEVPQTEDVGVDAVATLLREDKGMLHAEESFCVQFKAKSVRRWSYLDDEYQWLRFQQLPMYWGSVDLEASSIELFSFHELISRVDAAVFRGGIAYLDFVPNTFENGVVHQRLGPPILHWTHEEGQSREFRELAYKVMKAWLDIDIQRRATREIGYVRRVDWETNKLPIQSTTMLGGNVKFVKQDFEAAVPYLAKIIMHQLPSIPTAEGGEEQRKKLVDGFALYLICKMFQDQGVHGIHDTYAGMWEHMVKRGLLKAHLDVQLVVSEDETPQDGGPARAHRPETQR